MKTKRWIHGLVAAFIGGAAGAVPLVIIKPEVFNLSKGLYDLVEVCAVYGILFSAAYLKQSPLPSDDSASQSK